jgi:hypothetical protein
VCIVARAWSRVGGGPDAFELIFGLFLRDFLENLGKIFGFRAFLGESGLKF